MTFLALPWTEMCVALPFLGAGAAFIYRDPFRTSRWAVSFSAAILVLSFMPWIALSSGQSVPGPYFAVDGLTGLLIPLVSLLHFLTVLATARVKLNRTSLVGHMIGEGIRLGTFAVAPDRPWLLILFLILGVIPPFVELTQRKKPTRIYTMHMTLFVVLLAGGWIAIERGMTTFGSTLLMLSVLVRSGTVPAHLWVSDLVENATFGTALLFVTPLVGVFTTLRLILPIAPEWILSGISYVSLITALYAAGMATVQTEARRFFAYLFLSHASLVLVGLELHTTASLTGSLCLWVSISVSLGGLALRSGLLTRYGRLTLTRYLGLYEQSRTLAICFLPRGWAAWGSPARSVLSPPNFCSMA
ncbi:MAG: proton-conducting transporter membrane subunit [Gemmataceae bacterium]